MAEMDPGGTVPSSATVADGLAAADLRVLVLSLFHVTGDERWLEPPYRPARDIRLIADPGAGFPADVQDEIRAAAMTILGGGAPAAKVDDPGVARFHRMMSVCLGEDVPAEYVPMMRADFGFDDADTQWRASPPVPLGLDVLVIGAGVSGICLAAKLDRLGIPFTVIEKNANVGGTWFENRYPGCGVDTPNHFYSYSFAPNPAWERYFSRRDELQGYLDDCADGFGIRDRIRFDTEVLAATWDDDRWVVTVRDREGTESTMTARALVCATGHFNRPHLRFSGDDEFGGEVLHTARWPTDADLTGKRVAVIGTGASSMQIVPTVVDDVAELVVFQRTPQWVREVPEYDVPVDRAARWLFAQVPYYGRWYRFAQFWRFGDGLLRYLRKDPEWPHPERALNRTNDRHRQEMTAYITSQLAGRPDLIDRCLPTYPAFGKRILIDNGWFTALVRPHVRLVDVAVERLEPAGVRAVDGTLHEVDVVVLATGFDVRTLAAHIDIRGRDGRRLADDWADENPTAHLGITVPRFPNMFVMYGPNTNVGHGGSGMWLAETQSRYITGCLTAMVEQDLVAIEVREEIRQAYTEWVDALHEELIWTHPGMTTYYRNRLGRVRSPMPFRLVDYWHMARQPDLDDFVCTGRDHRPPADPAIG